MSTVNSATSSQDILNSLSRSKALNEKADLDTQSRFLKLLTTQLQNQDPMNPMDNAQTTSQLAQISTVDGIERLNSTLGTMMGNMKSSETLQAAALVGRQVMLDGKDMVLAEKMAIGGIQLEGEADSVVVSIKDKNGLEVASLDLKDLDAGSHAVVWDGKTFDGSQAADGTYTISVNATLKGEKVTAKTLQMTTVTNVVADGDTVQLDVGKLGRIGLSDIRMII